MTISHQIPSYVQKGYQGKLGTELPDSEEQLFQINMLPILDIESFKRICSVDGWEDILSEGLNVFLTTLPNETDLIESAHKNHDWKQVEKLAHKMKGGCTYSGLEKLEIACQFLERYIKAGHSEQNEKLYEQMMNAIRDTVPEVENWLKHH